VQLVSTIGEYYFWYDQGQCPTCKCPTCKQEKPHTTFCMGNIVLEAEVPVYEHVMRLGSDV
jgi:hypothetical protein